MALLVLTDGAGSQNARGNRGIEVYRSPLGNQIGALKSRLATRRRGKIRDAAGEAAFPKSAPRRQDKSCLAKAYTIQPQDTKGIHIALLK